MSERTAAEVVVEDNRERVETLDRLHSLSDLLDQSITVPGTDYRIGIDPIVGILPVVGDLPMSAISAYIVVEAIYLGVPKETIARMALNLVVDSTFGSLPLVGPVFDAVWKANARNVELLESRVDDPGTSTRDRRLLVGVFLLVFLLIAGVSIATGAAVLWLLGKFGVTF